MDLTSIEMLALVGLVVSGFVATSMDNLLILVVLLGANEDRRSAVLLGFLISSIAVLCTSVLGVLVGAVVGAAFIGYLGIVPLLLGCYMLYCAWREDRQPSVAADLAGNRAEPGIWLGTFFLMFSNSGDSVAVFLPLIAESGRPALLTITCSYLLMSIVWAGLSYVISGQPLLAKNLEKRAQKIIPWIMIGVGLYILADTATDTLV